MGDNYSFQNIIDANGFGIAFTGMAIVFFALAVITLFISALPRVLARLSGILPPEVEPSPKAATNERRAQPSDQAVVAAIGYVLHLESQTKHT